MQTIRVALVACLAAVALTACPGCGDDPAGPVVVVPARHDFGEVLHGDHLKQTFTIENNSDRTVAITLAKTTCVCFKVSRKPRLRLDPGERTDIEITLESDATPPQRLRGKYLDVRTDHPEVGAIHVPLEGTIFSPLYTVPKDRLAFGMVSDRPEPFEPRTIEIKPERGYEVALDTSLEDWPKGWRISQPQWFDIVAKTQDDGVIVLTVALRKDATGPPGRFRAFLNVALKLKGPRIDGEEQRFRGFRLEGQFPARPN